MNTTFNIFLAVHIIGGAVGLLAGLLNVIGKKGDKKHRLIGRVFFYSMSIAGASSLVISVLNPNLFLFMIGVFTLYMVLTGYRYIYLKMLNKGQKPALDDWVITYAMLGTGIVMIGFGAFSLFGSNLFGLVYLTFGFFGLLFVRGDFINYRGNSEKRKYWLLAHLQRMMGAYIAALTAFLVVNASWLPDQIPGILYWLLPTMVFTPLIIIWSRKYA